MKYHIDADKLDSIGRLSQSEKVPVLDEKREFLGLLKLKWKKFT